MPSAVHEAIVELIRAQPASALALARDVIDVDVEATLIASETRIVDPTVPQLISPAMACDLAFEVLLAAPEANGPTHAGFLIEVQETRSPVKELSWPSYWAAMRQQVKGGKTILLVITTDAAVERWASRVLADVIPRVGIWAVLGPASVKRISDVETARREPAATLISGLIHARDGDLELLPALAAACSKLPEEPVILCYDIIIQRLGAFATAAMEGHMLNYDFKGPLSEKLREQGRVQEARRLLAVVIESRGLVVAPSHETAMASTKDMAMFDTWIRRAAVARTVDEIFADHVAPSSATER